LLIPDLVRVTPGEALRVGPAPKCRSSAPTEGPEKSFRRTCRKDFEGDRKLAGRFAEAEEQVAAGRRKSPEAVTEKTTESDTAATVENKFSIGVLARKFAAIAATLEKSRILQSEHAGTFPLPVERVRFASITMHGNPGCNYGRVSSNVEDRVPRAKPV
jgi:hypothetical protein